MAKNEAQEHRDARFLQEIESLREEIAAEQAGTEPRRPDEEKRDSASDRQEEPEESMDSSAKATSAPTEDEPQENDADDNDSSAQEDEPAKEHSKKRKRDSYRDADFRSTLRELRSFTSDDSEDRPINRKMSLATLLGGDILAGPWFRKQFFYILMVLAMIFVYISNRYTCQQKMIEQRALNDTLLDRRYKALTRSSQLKERMRRSYIENALTDTTLQTPNTPSYNLKVEEE